MFQESLTFEEWRNRVRPLLSAGVEPDIAARRMVGDATPPFPTAPAAPAGLTAPAAATEPAAPATPTRSLTLPAALMRLLDSISCFRAAGRYELMYRLAWRTLFERPRLLEDAADADVRRAMSMDAAIRRDVHKMHAFVRFRELSDEAGEAAYFAWFEPEHDILRRGSTFFVKRFPNMKWTIATPHGAVMWDKNALHHLTSPDAGARPARDAQEDLWRTYYRSICNAARINVAAMQREMPQKYWKNLPEAADIGRLIHNGRTHGVEPGPKPQRRAGASTQAMQHASAVAAATSSAASTATEDGPQGCRRCDLWQRATQAVLGNGPKHARIMLVGEQPGDAEDLQGLPFVGPAGRILDAAIAAAGLERARLYVTNAVKHFKWEPRGKRRLHKKPDLPEVRACNVWLLQEITEVNPAVIVALGATALHALAGRASSIEAARGQTLAHGSGVALVATYHPSAILRAEGDRAAELRALLVEDLIRAGQLAT